MHLLVQGMAVGNDTAIREKATTVSQCATYITKRPEGQRPFVPSPRLYMRLVGEDHLKCMYCHLQKALRSIEYCERT